jgi:hypothetical protein
VATEFAASGVPAADSNGSPFNVVLPKEFTPNTMESILSLLTTSVPTLKSDVMLGTLRCSSNSI